MDRLRVGVIGCGAVTERYHLPACQRVGGVEVVCLVDQSKQRAGALADRFGVPHVEEDFRKAPQNLDAVVVALPNHLHAPVACEFLRRGIHVLCEKPLARSVTEGRQMIEAARTGGALLAVGLVRRAYVAATAVKGVLDAGILGDLEGFDVREGSDGAWSAQSLYRYNRSESGGGCLMDTGSHLLDLLLWWLGDFVRLERYEDDSWGGVEANARLSLVLSHGGREIPGTAEISANRPLRGYLRIRGSRGRVEMLDPNTARLEVRSGRGAVVQAPLGVVGCPPAIEELDNFVRQMERFVAAVRGQADESVTGEEALRALSIIEECYRRREAWTQPWDVLPVDPVRMESPEKAVSP